MPDPIARTLATTLCLTLAAVPASAGPWVREKGSVFLSFGGNVAISDAAQRPVHWDPTLYLEYGLTDRITVGLDVYIANGAEEETATAFVRFPIRSADSGWPVAMTLAMGTRNDKALGVVDTLARAGISVGRSLPNGWLSADLTGVYAVEAERLESKLDLTWGWNFADDWTSIVQLQSGVGTAGDIYVKLAPSVVYDLNRFTKVEVGLVQAFTGDGGTGLRVSTWIEF